MCGCGNNNGCTIILIIIILKYLGLLDTCNPSSRNAITLLLLWWLCGSGNFFGGNCGANKGNNCGGMMPMQMPMNSCCMPKSCCCR
ncbi:MAG: hypothetical protein RR844_02250 [Clostridium sp.]